eukprot:1115458-Rhodomonas_salina.1
METERRVCPRAIAPGEASLAASLGIPRLRRKPSRQTQFVLGDTTVPGYPGTRGNAVTVSDIEHLIPWKKSKLQPGYTGMRLGLEFLCKVLFPVVGIT